MILGANRLGKPGADRLETVLGAEFVPGGGCLNGDLSPCPFLLVWWTCQLGRFGLPLRQRSVQRLRVEQKIGESLL